MSVYSIANQKGGVGKTTTTVNLAAALALANRRVLAIDFDSQANLSTLLGVRNAPASAFDALLDPENVPLASLIRRDESGLHFIPATRALAGLESALRDEPGRELLLREALEPLLSDYDDVLIDHGPTLGLGLIMGLCASDLALIPLQCERLAVEGLAQILKTVDTTRRRLNPKLGYKILLTMVDQRLSDGIAVANAVRSRFGADVFAAEIPAQSKLKLGGIAVHHSPSSPGAKAFKTLAEEVISLA